MMPGAPGRRRRVRRPRPAHRDARSPTGHTPGLGTILVGDDAASAGYVGMKQAKARGARAASSPHMHLPDDATQADVLAAVRALNDDPARRRRCSSSTRRRRRSTSTPRCSRSTPTRTSTACTRSTWAGSRSAMPGPGAVHARRASRRCSRTTRSRSPGREVCILGRGHHARPAARAAAVAEAADRQRGGHRRAHRRARLARLHAARRHRRRRRRRARHPAARAHHARRGRGRRRRALRGPQAAPRRRRGVRGGRRVRSRRASAASARPRSRCCSATPSRPPSATWGPSGTVEAAWRRMSAEPDPVPAIPRSRRARCAAPRWRRPRGATAG